MSTTRSVHPGTQWWFRELPLSARHQLGCWGVAGKETKSLPCGAAPLMGERDNKSINHISALGTYFVSLYSNDHPHLMVKVTEAVRGEGSE